MTSPLILQVPQGQTQAPHATVSDIRKLLDTDRCPCCSGKVFGECCRPPYKPGWTPENTLHILCLAPPIVVIGSDEPGYWAVQSLKLDGSVPADAVVANLRNGLVRPAVQRAFNRLPWAPVPRLKPEEATVEVAGVPEEPQKIAIEVSENLKVSVGSNSGT